MGDESPGPDLEGEIVDMINDTVNNSYQLEDSLVELFGRRADDVGGTRDP